MQQMSIFKLAVAYAVRSSAQLGYDKLQAACDVLKHCDTGSAVITSGFDLKAKYIIHAVVRSGAVVRMESRRHCTMPINVLWNLLLRTGAVLLAFL